MRGRGLLCKKPPPSRSLPKKITTGRFWGRGRFSERSASPPDPLSRRAAGNRLGCSFGVERPCECGWSPMGLVVVTAADRAAATFAACGGEPLRPHIAGTSPFRGGFAWGSAAEGTFFASCAPSIRRYKKSRWHTPSAFLVSSSPVPNAARPRRLCQPPWTQPTRKEPNHLSGGTNSEEPSQPKRQPLFGREGSGGRGASLREAASPPRIPPFPYITLMQNSSQTLAQ